MTNGIAEELEKLKSLNGADFVTQLKRIASRKVFHPIKRDSKILITGGEKHPDFPRLLEVAQKVVEHGYTVYILPNPDAFRTADFIFERRGVFKLFDLKTISGKSTAENRLLESIGQTNRVLLHITSDYNPGALARSIKRYFESNGAALEVLVFKGKKSVSITRDLILSPNYYQLFMKRLIKGE